MKRIFASLLACLILICSLSACGNETQPSAASASPTENAKRLSIVCTNFPEYDFVRQIVGDKADVTMLLKPGAESHTFEPTPKDIITIQNSDLFLYVGGDSDEWVNGILDSMDQSKMHIFKLMDCVDLVQEELVAGMQPETGEKSSPSDDKPEMDEHVWTSPANAIQIVKALTETISGLDKDNAQTYQKNAEAYIAKLEKLDKDFHDVIDHAKRKEIIVGDRFPFLYFAKEFGLTYYAAFPGCSTDTEANPATIAFLVDKVKEDHIPVVFHIEMSNEQMSKAIAEATGAKNELLNAVHNVSDEEFKKGVTYIDLMNHNVKVLKEALN